MGWPYISGCPPLYEIDVTGCMTLEEYLDDHDPSGTKREAWEHFDDTLTSDGASYVCDNFRAEYVFSASVWEDVFSVLVAGHQNGHAIDIIENELVEAFRQHQCTGREPRTPSPKGRAVARKAFREYVKEASVSSSPESIERFFEKLLSGSGTPALLSIVPLGSYLMWSTFSCSGRDPFEACSLSVEHVHAYVGTEPSPDGTDSDLDLILLVYNLPDHISARVPTIADAYSGTVRNEKFQRCDPSDDWGTTSGGTPEVVHDVILGEHLVDLPTDETPHDVPPIRYLEHDGRTH